MWKTKIKDSMKKFIKIDLNDFYIIGKGIKERYLLKINKIKI